MSASHELKIIGVTLLDRSLKTYRELADDRRDVYPVVVTCHDRSTVRSN